MSCGGYVLIRKTDHGRRWAINTRDAAGRDRTNHGASIEEALGRALARLEGGGSNK